MTTYHPELSIVVPVYKEASNIKPFLERIEKVLAQITSNYEILFCLDPSPDQTEQIIRLEIDRNPFIKLIVFSRRFGQPAATIAGILNCQGNSCVVIDVDLQDPPELIQQLYAKIQDGYEVVYAKRKSRKGETIIKQLISHIGYSVINKLSDVSIPRNTGDFRIITRRVMNEIKKLHESHGFLRGLVAYVGYKQAFIEYDRDERLTGKGNYNRFTGSLKIGLNGLISFSSRPLQIMSIIGAFLAGFSFLLGGWYVFQKLYGIDISPGLSTTVLVVTFFSGVQLLCLGLMGEYIGRIYDEVKRRPMFIVDYVVEKPSTNQLTPSFIQESDRISIS
ncbi:MAG: glycosyl transferase [Gammaproteobacteria bacterium RIFCSPHIGHO2_12_FULL_37_14]|nr:MAG: glycosyl transferase [Gammaproteobacteria bacterium RIFCSPHIGHO2_12_FULL_37_14]